MATIPHDDSAYTQGLEMYEGLLLESTGKRGVSDRRRIDPTTGEVVGLVALPGDLFGEGLTVANGLIYQLTFTSGSVLVSDPANLSLQNELGIDRDGWGICFDGTHLITSDGTSDLVFRDPTTLDPVRVVTVRLNGEPIRFINELECVGGQVLANIYGLDQIVAINIADGNVDAVVDASGLRPANLPISDLDYAFNGIAQIPTTDRYYVTGKWWPVMYEIRFVQDG